MDFDSLSGRAIPRNDPWQQILRQRHYLKQRAMIPAHPAKASKQPTTVRTPPSPRLPDNDYKIIFRPRSGLRVAAWQGRQIMQSILQASRIPERIFHARVTTQPQAQQNLIVVSTPDEACVEALRQINTLQLGTATYEVMAYLKTPPGTVRGVIHGIDQGTTQEQLNNIIATTGPRIIDARMLGASTSAVITFEGLHVPFYIKAYGLLTRCRPYRQTVQCCSLCGELGHRRDVCPNPDTSTCAKCHAKDPAPDHDCTPVCQLCGLNHLTASRECRKKLRPPPPPLRVRERALTEQAHRHSWCHQQRSPLPQAPRQRPAEAQVSWSAVAATPPTALEQFPPLPTHAEIPPTPINDPRCTALEQENAQLRTQLADNTKHLATLEQELEQLRTQIQRQSSSCSESTAPSTSYTTPRANNSAPSAEMHQHSSSLSETASPAPSTSLRAGGAPASTIDDLKRFIFDMVSQLRSEIQVLDKRLCAIEATKKKKHKKPKHRSLPSSSTVKLTPF